MFSIFSCPKPFEGKVGVIQRNAIKSWTLLTPQPEIILIGDEKGTVNICEEFGLRNIPAVKKNEVGTPLVNSVFEIGQSESKSPVVCYVNTDIILMSDFSYALKMSFQHYNRCIVMGRRWDINIDKNLGFSKDWEDDLKSKVRSYGKINRYAVDYFIFLRGFFSDILPFAIGRGAWDNWLIYFACLHGITIDATEMIMAVHQNHDYSHIGNGIREDFRMSEEGSYNIRLAARYRLGIEDATHRIIKNRFRRNLFASIYLFLLRLPRKDFPVINPFMYKVRSVINLLDRKMAKLYSIL